MILASILLFSVIELQESFAEHSLISVQTDNDNYEEGDTITISGTVNPIVNDSLVIFQLFIDGNIVDIAKIIVARDGTYTHTVIAEGPLWKKLGDYTVRVTYGENNIAESEFNYLSNNPYLKNATDFVGIPYCVSKSNCAVYLNFRGTIIPEDTMIPTKLFGFMYDRSCERLQGMETKDTNKKYPSNAKRLCNFDDRYYAVVTLPNGIVCTADIRIAVYTKTGQTLQTGGCVTIASVDGSWQRVHNALEKVNNDWEEFYVLSVTTPSIIDSKIKYSCNDNFKLLQRLYDYRNVCVTLETANKLEDRGWTLFTDDPPIRILTDKTRYDKGNNVHISGFVPINKIKNTFLLIKQSTNEIDSIKLDFLDNGYFEYQISTNLLNSGQNFVTMSYGGNEKLRSHFYVNLEK